MNMAIISLLGRGGICVRFELLSRAEVSSQSRDELGLCSPVFAPFSIHHAATSSLSQYCAQAQLNPYQTQALCCITCCAEGGNYPLLQTSPYGLS